MISPNQGASVCQLRNTGINCTYKMLTPRSQSNHQPASEARLNSPGLRPKNRLKALLNEATDS